MKRTMQKIPKAIGLCAALVMLAACGEKDGNTQPVESKDVVSAPAVEKAGPQTEAEYRAAIAQLGESEDDLRQAADYYEELLARDLFTEEDYIALADLCGKLGDTAGRYRMLSKAQRLFPSREYVELLNGIVWEIDDPDSDVGKLAERAGNCLRERDLSGLQEVLASDLWRENMSEKLAGVVRNTRYSGPDAVWTVAESGSVTEILCQKADGASLLYRGNATGALLAEGRQEDAVWNGAFSVEYYDGEWNLFRKCEGTFAQNVCVDEIRIFYEDREYTGSLDAGGAPTVSQPEEMSAEDRVIYAYDSAEVNYLYAENEKAESFRIDVDWLGLTDSAK